MKVTRIKSYKCPKCGQQATRERFEAFGVSHIQENVVTSKGMLGSIPISTSKPHPCYKEEPVPAELR